MDILSFILGLKKGMGMGETADTDDIDDMLDTINGEVIGETQYRVTFIGATGEVLGEVPVYEGYNCADPVSTGVFETPTKESTRYYNYVFAGWSKTEGGSADSSALVAIEGNTTLYAVFTAVVIKLASGQCGTNATWYINPDYVLFIRGSGAMADYSPNGVSEQTFAPWYDYKDQIVSVEFGSAITGVGKGAFYGCTALSEVSFGAGIKEIKYQAFEYCTALESIAIPDSVLFIYGAFTYSGLKTITFPATLRFIGFNAFYSTPLESATFGATTDWRYGDYDSETVVPADGLADPATAATYLTETYTAQAWFNADYY